jgi:hypothetical protein
MNPYPFALLNHFTVPFKRSTSDPLLSHAFLWGFKDVLAPIDAICKRRVKLSRKAERKKLAELSGQLCVREKQLKMFRRSLLEQALLAAFFPNAIKPQN